LGPDEHGISALDPLIEQFEVEHTTPAGQPQGPEEKKTRWLSVLGQVDPGVKYRSR
jgi:hypothetical protein